LTREGADADLAWTGPSVRGLRVLGFCDYFGMTSSGGVERVAVAVYKRMVAAGAVVTVVTTGPSVKTGRTLSPDGVRIIGVPAYDLSGLLGVQTAVAPRLRLIASNVVNEVAPHVLHANGLHFQTSLLGGAVHRSSEVPLVTSVHVGSVSQLGLPSRLAATAYEQTIGRWLLRQSAHVIAVSGDAAQNAARRGAHRGALTIVENGVDHERFGNLSPVPREGRPRVLYLGRLIGNKGPIVLVKALAQLRARGYGVSAVFLGDGPQKASVARAIEAAGLAGDVALLGHVDAVESFMRAGDILVRPSSTEGMSLALLEAMAGGLVVVASDIPANRDLVTDGKTGLLFPVGRVGALAKCLAALMTDPARCHRLGQAAQRRVMSNTWARCAAETAVVLASSTQWQHS